MRILLVLALAWALPETASSQPLLANPSSRSGISLNGDWAMIVDPYETGFYSYRYSELEDGFFRDYDPPSPRELVEYDFDTAGTLHVPADWNSQDDRLFFYEGTVWYRKLFDFQPTDSRRYFLHFGAANYNAVVYLNGERVGDHTGGYTPFEFEVTGRLEAGSNSVVVKVDNRRDRAGVPTVNTDWWNYGGLTRDVRLIEVPETFIRDFTIHLDPDDPDQVIGHVQMDGPEAMQSVRVHIADPELLTTVRTDADGQAVFRMDAFGLPRWSPDAPRLADVTIESETDRVQESVGFRTIETRGTDILLNGESVYLRGISLHEVAPLREGRATTREDAEVLLGWAKELGCNFVRLAHYPHNEHMARVADRMGIMLWAEIPVYWTILWDNPDTYANAEGQLTEMVVRDRNRASVIIWSVANETPRGDSRLRFLTGLIDRARELDPTRLISAATELSYEGRTLVVDDPLGERLDVLGVNEYLGWYGGYPEDIASREWATPFDKPVVISEFGGGAKAGLHGPEEHRWTEEYQAAVYRGQIAMLRRVPFIRGMTPWILTDFRSPRRPLARIQDYWNRKGLISDRGERKLAFYVLQEYYREF